MILKQYSLPLSTGPIVEKIIFYKILVYNLKGIKENHG